MTFGYEYSLMLLSGLGIAIYILAYYLQPTHRQKISVIGLTSWLIVPVALVSIYTFAIVTSTSAYLGKVDSDYIGTIVVIALSICACILAWREIELFLRYRRLAANHDV